MTLFFRKAIARLAILRIRVFGDSVLFDGGKILLCWDCCEPFASYARYGEAGYVFDFRCKKCERKRKEQEAGKK